MIKCTKVWHFLNRVAQFERGDFSTINMPRPWQRKTVPNPLIIDHIK
jgi:hypothetical protein